jgi:D-amino peptidase
MKIYILCDMEGTSGLWQPEQTDLTSPQYQHARGLLAADVNAAIAGAFEGGAAELVVCDTHAGGRNFIIEQMADDPRVVYETPSGGDALPAIDESFDGLILTGHHAMAGTLNGFLDHTMSSRHWFSMTLNGQPVGEIALETAVAGHFGVPLIMVAGDRAACEEAEAMFTGVVTAPVKEGLGRNRARCLPPGQGQALIRTRAAEAVGKAKKLKPWKPDLPITLELTFTRADYADDAATNPAIERVDARTCRKVVQTAHQVCRF